MHMNLRYINALNMYFIEMVSKYSFPIDLPSIDTLRKTRASSWFAYFDVVEIGPSFHNDNETREIILS